MDKPNNPYQPGTKLYRLFEHDCIGKTIKEIAAEIGSTERTVTNYMFRISEETGYHVPFAGSRWKYALTEQASPPKKNKLPNKCSTCCNLDCPFLYARAVVCWIDCIWWTDKEAQL